MLPGDQTCWLAADFDGQAAMLDALAYLKAARAFGAPAALEVSRSGIGAHVWIFFTDPVPAATARQLGTVSSAKRSRSVAAWTWLLDRLFPSQDVLPGQGPGNLIAAPLHGKSREPAPRSSSIWPHWSRSRTSGSTSPPWSVSPRSRLEARLGVREPTKGVTRHRAQPARSTKTQPNPAPIVHLSRTAPCGFPAGAKPFAVRDLKHAASTYNPEFYDRQRRRQSTWNVPRIIRSYDETLDDGLVLPRGLVDTATRSPVTGSKVDVDDSEPRVSLWTSR